MLLLIRHFIDDFFGALPGPGQAHLYGALRNLQAVHQFLDRDVILVFHQQDGPVFWVQFLQGSFELIRAGLQQLQFLLGVIHGICFILNIDYGVLLVFSLVRHTHVVVFGLVPGIKTAVTLELGELKEDFHEDILHHVLGDVGVFGEADALAVDFIAVAVIEQAVELGFTLQGDGLDDGIVSEFFCGSLCMGSVEKVCR
jgi:hypothetical protein